MAAADAKKWPYRVRGGTKATRSSRRIGIQRTDVENLRARRQEDDGVRNEVGLASQREVILHKRKHTLAIRTWAQRGREEAEVLTKLTLSVMMLPRNPKGEFSCLPRMREMKGYLIGTTTN